MSPKKVGLIAHTRKAGVAKLLALVTEELRGLGISPYLEQSAAALIGEKSDATTAPLAAETDLLVVLGADGTLMNVAGQLRDHVKPIFGINVGSLGFLTCSSSSAYREAVEAIAQGKITFSDRTLLEVAIKNSHQGRAAMIGLNDAVFSRGELSRLIRLRACVNGEPLTEFNADGLIVATPTGSTAYSLPPGGPRFPPESGVLVITPICPHVLTNRSIIGDESSLIGVQASDPDYPVYLTVDGREPVRLETNAV